MTSGCTAGESTFAINNMEAEVTDGLRYYSSADFR